MIVVTGMHRSGTSLAANLLHDLGLDFGDQSGFFAADKWNEKGYYEQKDVIDLNHRIITRFRNSVGGFERKISYFMYIQMPSIKKRDFQAAKLKHNLMVLGRKYKKQCVKDPRFCLTFPYWREWSILDRCVVCLRHPLEVVMSLKRRQRIPVILGFNFWNYHMESLRKSLEDTPTLYLQYDELIREDAGKTLSRIRRFFQLDIECNEMKKIHRNIVNPRLRHFRRGGKKVLPLSTRRIWEHFTQCYEKSLDI